MLFRSYADEVHEHTSVYQLNELDFMYRQLSSDMQEEYVSLLTVFENLEALYICRNVITVYPDCKSMIDVARQKLMNDPTFKHLSEDCQEYYFDFEAYASHLQEHGKFLVTEHGIFELPGAGRSSPGWWPSSRPSSPRRRAHRTGWWCRCSTSISQTSPEDEF